MVFPTIVMALLATVLLTIGYARGHGEHWAGLRAGGLMTVQVIPLLVFAFVAAGMAQALIPPEIISKTVGGESGWRGILIGSFAGGLTPGGPFVSFPIVAALYRSGASIGTTVAFVTGWSLWAVARLPMEIGLLGLRFTLIRIASTLLFPPLAGLIAQLLFGRS